MHIIWFIDLCSDQHKSFDPQYGFITISWNNKINHISTVFGDHYTDILKIPIVYSITLSKALASDRALWLREAEEQHEIVVVIGTPI